MAAAPSLPFTLTNGVTADATQVMSNLNALVTWITNNASQIDASTVFTAIPSGPATNPTSANQFTRKAYVDAFFPVSSGNLAAGAVIAGKIAAGTIVNADISAAAAIAYSKLALAGSITNADISGGAAIVRSKLALTGTIVNSDLSTAAGELGAGWANYIPSPNNVTGAAFEATYKQIGRTIIARFRFTAGTATATGPVQLGMPWTAVSTTTTMGLGFNAAGRVDFVGGTNTVNMYKDAVTLNWTAGNSVAGAGWQMSFDI